MEDYVLEHSEMRKSTKDCYISFEGNRYSVPYQYGPGCKAARGRLTDLLRPWVDSHSQNELSEGTDDNGSRTIPRPAYPSGVRAVREVFLAQFPRSNPFLDGLVKAKYGNARYHMLQILNLLEDYPGEVVESARGLHSMAHLSVEPSGIWFQKLKQCVER